MVARNSNIREAIRLEEHKDKLASAASLRKTAADLTTLLARTLSLINGGAILALLAFLESPGKGQFSQQDLHRLILAMDGSFFFFFTGLATAVLYAVMAYWAVLEYADAGLPLSAKKEGKQSKTRYRSMQLAALSFLCFGLGCAGMLAAFRAIQ